MGCQKQHIISKLGLHGATLPSAKIQILGKRAVCCYQLA